MARKRMIKPDFWRNPDLAKVGYFDRLLFIGLWQVADDYGNGTADPVLLATELFPFDFSHDPQAVMSACTQGLEALAEQGFIVLYRAEGKRYYSVPKFAKHQTINRPSNPQHPSPEEGTPETPTHAPLSESSVSQSGVESEPDVSTHDRLTLKEGREREGEGEVEQKRDGSAVAHVSDDDFALIAPEEAGPSLEDKFAEFYDAYPRKRDRRKAWEAFEAAVKKKRQNPDMLIEASRRLAADPNLPDKQHVPFAATWLNAERWDDPPYERRSTGNAQDRRSEQIVDLVARNLPGHDAQRGELEA